MDCQEIERYLSSGSEKAVCVDRQLLGRYPAFVRDVTIVSPVDVMVEINAFGYDEGGLAIRFHYNDMQLLIFALEEFLGRKLADWENVTKSGSYPERPVQLDFAASASSLKSDLVNQQIDLPKGWLTQEVSGGHWRDMLQGNA